MGIISTHRQIFWVGDVSYAVPNSVQVLGSDVLGYHPPNFFIIFDVPNPSAGSTLTLSSGPRFQQTVDFLTNGRQGGITFFIGVAPAGGGAGGGYANSHEKRQFNGGYPGIDLRGFTIEGLDFHLEPVTPEENYFLVDFTFVIRGKFPVWWRLLFESYAFLNDINGWWRRLRRRA